MGKTIIQSAVLGAACLVCSSAMAQEDAFLKPPLYSTAFSHGFGTLYTAAYRPREGRMQVLWPAKSWDQTFADFTEGAVRIVIPGQG